jgi:PEP-CTERM motif
MRRMTMYQIRKVTIALALVSVVFMSAASAAIIGDLKTGSGGTVTVTLSSITFNSDPGSNPAGPPWNGEVALGTSLQFFGCGGVLGTAGCLDAAPFNPNEAIEIANGVSITLSGGLGPNNPFLSFAGNGISHATLLYTVLSLGPGSANLNCAALALGDSCSVFAGSPILLTLNATGTTVTLAATGTATDGHGSSNWLGAFQVPIAGKTPEQILLELCPSGTCGSADFARGTTETSSQSGDFVASTVPEPGTISMALIGLGLGALSLRRRKNRA